MCHFYWRCDLRDYLGTPESALGVTLLMGVFIVLLFGTSQAQKSLSKHIQ